MKGQEEHCLATGMDAYLMKPVRIERLRTTLERWLPIQGDDDPTSPADTTKKSISAIDRNVLAAWLGNDGHAVDNLLDKFRQTAIPLNGKSMMLPASVIWQRWPQRRIS
jgi:two-component system, sensor histidine kinase and response regulator